MAAPGLDILGSIFWQFLTFIVAIVGVIGFLVYRYYLEPPIARAFTAARWKKGPIGFVQDDANVVRLVTSDFELPEGVTHNKLGFVLHSRPPHVPIVNQPEETKRGPGRPPKPKEGEIPTHSLNDSEEIAMLEDEALKTVLQVPILEGFGRGCYFGYTGVALGANLKTLAMSTNNAITVTEVEKSEDGHHIYKSLQKYVGHADLRVLKEIIPATISRTQLSNLYRYAVNKGYEKSGKDQMKLIYIAIAAAIPIACLGLVVFLILNGGK